MKPTLLVLLTFSLNLVPTCALGEVDYEVTYEHECLREAAKYAISKGDKVLFDTLLKAGFQINKPLDDDPKQFALHVAASNAQPDMIRHLLQKGADPLVRNMWGSRPIDGLERERKTDIVPILAALTRQPTDYDKKQLMQIPVPVWHQILGAPDPASDPLAPPAVNKEVPPLIPFVSINDEDPAPEMIPALNAHFPGWRPRSSVEETKGNDGHGYRDLKTREPGEIVEITLVGASSKNVPDRGNDALANHARSNELPAYEFKVRHATGPVLAGGGWGGYVVLIAGYWVKVGESGWDE